MMSKEQKTEGIQTNKEPEEHEKAHSLQNSQTDSQSETEQSDSQSGDQSDSRAERGSGRDSQAGDSPNPIRGASVGDAVTRARSKGGKAGTLYKPAVVKRLLRSVQSGLTLKQAATAAGISETTLHNWKREHPEFLQKLEETREIARQQALEVIWAARGDDWRAAESFLKYSFWQEYRSGNQVNVNQNTAVVVEKTMTEEERMKLIKQRERTQRQLDAPQQPVIEAQVVTEPEQQPEQPQPQHEPQEGFYQKPPGWDKAHEENKKEAALFATKEDEQAERDRQLLRNKLEIASLFGDD